MFHVGFSYALNSLIFFLQFSLDQKICRGLLKKKKNVERSKISKTIFFFTKISSNTNILTVPEFICSFNNYSHKYHLASSTDIYIHTFSPVKEHNHNYDTILKQTTGKKSSVKNLPDTLNDEFL